MAAKNKTVPKTTSVTEIWLIGQMNQTFTNTSKLPTLREPMSVFFYHHTDEKKSIKQSARITVTELIGIWGKSGVPTSRSYDIEIRLFKIHAEWQCLKKALH